MSSDSMNRWLQRGSVDAEAYDATYERRAAAGENVHGEADFVMRFAPESVLDGGCGTGRVGRELARRGVDVAGVDIDDGMLATARRKAPDVTWHHADLATVDLARTFDVIVLAGNVMIFLARDSEAAVLANLARHLAPDGRLVAGFQLRAGDLSAGEYDAFASAAGLTPEERWSTWDCEQWSPSEDYVVFVHRKPADATSG